MADNEPVPPKVETPPAAASATPTLTPAPAPSTVQAAAVATPPAEGQPAEIKDPSKIAAQAIADYFSREGSIWKDIPQIFSSILSPDRPTRRMAIFFIFCLIATSSTVGLMLKRHWEHKRIEEVRKQRLEAKLRAEQLKRSEEDEKQRASLTSLGSFTIELKDVPSQRLGVGIVNMAELEIVVLCDDAETRNYIDGNLDKVRNQLTNIFTPMNREELMTREGKRKLKILIARKLNDWIPHGKVQDVYISKLVLN